MLFFNISSDKVQISHGSSSKYLDRNGIENTLGPVLIKLYNKSPFQEIFVLNGPGGFTNLRVGTLVLNLISKLVDYNHSKPIKIYSISKPELYKHLFHKGVLPRYGAIYLGQRMNIWRYDFHTDKYETIKLTELKKDPEQFLDYTKEKYWTVGLCKMLKFSNSEDGIIVTYKHNQYPVTIKDLKLKPQSHIEPKYFINAIN